MLQNVQTLLDLLLSGEKLSRGTIVATILIPKLEVYGFVPCRDIPISKSLKLVGLDMNMRETYIVANRLSVYNNGNAVWPIYHTISSVLENQYIPLPTNFISSPTKKEKLWLEYDKNGTPWEPLANDEKIMNKDGNMFFLAEKGKYLFYEKNKDVAREIYSSSMVVCRRINSITGNLTYELLNAEDLCPIVNKEIGTK